MIVNFKKLDPLFLRLVNAKLRTYPMNIPGYDYVEVIRMGGQKTLLWCKTYTTKSIF